MGTRRFVPLAAASVVVGAAVLLVLGARLAIPDRSHSPLAEQGKALFWGRARCSICHAVSGKGGGDRCPDLGTAAAMPGTLLERAGHRVQGLNAVEYLAQSLYDPGAYVVAGFPASLMPVADEPPIALTDDEVKALIAYLAEGASGAGAQGAPTLVEIDAAIRKARQGRREASPVDLAGADANAGRAVYETLKCGACHVIEGVTDAAEADAARKRGPDLTGIAAVQGARYLKESIVRPNAVVVAGGGGEWLADDGKTSRMPTYPNLSKEDTAHLVAFLLTLR